MDAKERSLPPPHDMTPLPRYGDDPDDEPPKKKKRKKRPEDTPPVSWPRYDDDPDRVRVPDLPGPGDPPDDPSPPERKLPRYGDLPRKTVFGEGEEDEGGEGGERT